MSHKEFAEKLHELSEDLVECLICEIDKKGLECMDTEETGEVVDMIKDLAEAKKNCFKAKYYETVVEAMEDAEEEEESMMKLAMKGHMGYTPRRSSSTGRYVGRPGYVPMYMWDDEDMMASDGMMGYTPTGGNRSQSGNNMSEMGGRGDYGSSQYGRPYEEFRMAKRRYTETKSPEDKQRMNEHANEHIMASITSLREVFNAADPDMKRRVKQDLASLVNEMNA